MKTITELVIIPATEAKEIIITKFGCDKCDYISDKNYDVEQHYLNEHVVHKQVVINNNLFYYFLTKEDAKLWCENNFLCHKQEINWVKPGWYITKSNFKTALVYPAESWIEEKMQKIQSITNDINSVNQLLKEKIT